MEKNILSLGKSALPVGYEVAKALNIQMHQPDEVLQWTEDGQAMVIQKTIYGISAIHLIVGFAAGALLAVPLGLVKPKTRYRRRRAATSARRVYRRRTTTRK